MQKSIAALCFCITVAVSGHSAEPSHDIHEKPQTVDYALILPGNLPHMLRLALEQADRLQLDTGQRETVRLLISEAPLKVFSRLSAAEKLEITIAADVLQRRNQLSDLQARLDDLSTLKRGATEAQIATINHLQTVMTNEQFQLLLKLAGVNAQL